MGVRHTGEETAGASRWMLLAHLGTSTAPFCSRTRGILGKHHDFLCRKCLLPELPPSGILARGIDGMLFSDIGSLYSTWGADAWHQPSSTITNGGFLQSVGVTSTLDSTSVSHSVQLLSSSLPRLQPSAFLISFPYYVTCSTALSH